jgi:ferredoxin
MKSNTIKKAVPVCYAGTTGERRYSSYSFLILALDCGECSASCPSLALPLGRKDHWIGDWVGLSVGLDTEARGQICSQTTLIELPQLLNEK